MNRNKIRRLLNALLISYAIVMSVNLIANYQYYAAGNDWKFSVFFTLSVTTIGWLGYIILYEMFFKRYLDWTKHPNRNLLMSVLITGAYGALLMIGVMKAMVWFFGFSEHSTYDYVNNSIYSVLFAMLIGLIVNGQEFLKQWKKSAEDNERMQREMLRSQYEALKSQVNPHFLFNSLNTLAAIIPEKPDVAVDFVQQLSKVFRYSLQYGGENTIDVETELKIVTSYLFLNQQRFDGKLLADVKINDAAMHKHIITQSLLMLVENAIKHNEISHLNPLTIWIYDEADYLVVRNTLQPKTLPEPSTHIGISNIISRYKLATDIPVQVTEDNKYFTVKIPLLHEHTATGR